MFKRSRPPSGVQPIPNTRSLSSPSQTPINRLQLTVMQRIDGLLSGDHAGLFPGHGSELGDARPYVPGDDPRHIDWAVTARNHEPHVRDTIADHELDVWLVLDSSSSIGLGTALATKHQLAWSAAGAFALLAASSGNRVGAIRTTPGRRKAKLDVVPARGGSRHVGALLAGLMSEPRDGMVGDLGGAIRLAARVAPRRGMAIVLSDFLGGDEWQSPMKVLARRHEVIAVEVVDPLESELPDVGLISVVDPETGRRRLVDTSRRSTRKAYAEEAESRRRGVSEAMRQAGVDHMTLRTDRDWVLDFVRFVSGRKARLAHSGRAR